MSEVKRLRLVDTHGYPALPVDDCIPGERWVSEADFDRVTAERDAALAELDTQTLRADAAVGDANEAERRLTAANERADVLEGLLWEYVDRDEVTNDWAREWLSAVEAALKPAEGDGDA